MRHVNEIWNVYICLFNIKGHILSFKKTYVCHLKLFLCLYVIKKKNCVYMSYKKNLWVYMSYKKNSCVHMSFNIKRHIYTSVISWWACRTLLGGRYTLMLYQYGITTEDHAMPLCLRSTLSCMLALYIESTLSIWDYLSQDCQAFLRAVQLSCILYPADKWKCMATDRSCNKTRDFTSNYLNPF